MVIIEEVAFFSLFYHFVTKILKKGNFAGCDISKRFCLVQTFPSRVCMRGDDRGPTFWPLSISTLRFLLGNLADKEAR